MRMKTFQTMYKDSPNGSTTCENIKVKIAVQLLSLVGTLLFRYSYFSIKVDMIMMGMVKRMLYLLTDFD